MTHQEAPVSSPEKVLTPLDPLAYLDRIEPRWRSTHLPKIADAGAEPASFRIQRLELKSTFDLLSWKQGLRQFEDGQKIHVALCRISGAERQRELAHSLPQQERANVLSALAAGATNLLVIVETASAKPRRMRQIFNALVRLTQEGRVSAWHFTGPDRATRWPSDGCRLVEAVQDTGTRIFVAGNAYPMDPMNALVMIIQFAMNAMHVIMLSAGLRRVWRERLRKGEWLRGHELLGMQLDEAGRPHYRPESIAVVRKIYALVADGMPAREVVSRIQEEHAEWHHLHCTPAGRKRGISTVPLTAQRIVRLIHSKVLVTGDQLWVFKEEQYAARYGTLEGLVDFEIQQRAAHRLLLDAGRRSYNKNSPWVELVVELIEVRKLSFDVLVDLSEGCLRWNPQGHVEVQCPRCRASAIDREDGETTVIETTGDYEVLELPDGTCREKFRIPRFRCDKCGKTTLPLGKPIVSLLLAGYRVPRCPFCPNPRVRVRQVAPREGWRAWRMTRVGYIGHCDACKERFPIADHLLVLEHKLRMSQPVIRPAQTRLPDEAQRDLDSFLAAGA